ncbi:MAG: hypothetical protein Solumvirus2_31 [Solumvirus sp.]|uniref:Transmembrane protein n=1 Tax=Solumvirus sp. TaxID=2487773 RepID=A0A3G5AI07_9VIRU|nr:MAG: hypothetical protein Solumvirus2_31 [Solumvirus sp.]
MSILLGILVILVHSVGIFGTVCPCGSQVYTYQTLQGCTSFSTSCSNPININGLNVNSLGSLSNTTFGNWQGSVTITNTSIINLNGLESLITSGPLTISGNPFLTTAVLPINSGNTIIIDSNPSLNLLSAPLLSFISSLQITNNLNLRNLNSFNTLATPGTVDITISGNGLYQLGGFANVGNIGTLYISESHLVNITGFSSVRFASTITLFNSSVQYINPIPLLVINGNGLTIQNLPNLQSLSFLVSISTISQMVLTGNVGLIDYSLLNKLTIVPGSFSTQGSCCPRYSQINAPFTISNFNGCIDCLTFTGVTLGDSFKSQIVPGVYYNITFQGPIESQVASVSVGTLVSQCNIITNIIVCLMPYVQNYTLGNFEVMVSVNNRSYISSGLFLEYVAMETYLGGVCTFHTESDNTQLVIPGTSNDQSQEANYVTYISLGVCLCIIFVILIMYFCRKRIQCLCRTVENRKPFKRLDLLYTDILDEKMTKKGAVLHRRSTTFGGFMTLSAIITCVVINSVLIYSFANYNTNVIVTQEPLLSRFNMTYRGNVTFLNYNRECSQNSFTIISNGFGNIYDVRYVLINTTNDVVVPLHGCQIFWQTTTEISSDSVSLMILSKSDNSLATGFEWYFESTDYFNNPSWIFGSMTNNVFKGQSQVLLNLISSVYGTSSTSKTGILSAFKSQMSQVDVMMQTKSVGIVFDIGVNQNLLRVVTSNNQSVVALISQMISIAMLCKTFCDYINKGYHKATGRTRTVTDSKAGGGNDSRSSSVEVVVVKPVENKSPEVVNSELVTPEKPVSSSSIEITTPKPVPPSSVEVVSVQPIDISPTQTSITTQTLTIPSNNITGAQEHDQSSLDGAPSVSSSSV